jgi:hypothetical protein
MSQVSACRPVDRKGSFWIAKFLGVSCLFFGTAFAVFVPASLEERIGGLLFFGLMPAVGVYASSHILSQSLALGGKLFEMIAVLCFRSFARLVDNFVIWANPPVSDVPNGQPTLLARCIFLKLFALSENAYRSIRYHYWWCGAVLIRFLCLLIRSAARFIIWVQELHARRMFDLACSGWRPRPLILTAMFLTAFGLGWCGGNAIWPIDLPRYDPTGEAAIDAVVERIISVESDGDPNAKNKRSSATGLGQFIDETWLDLIRTHRPDLARERSKVDTLALRRDAKVAREITTRFSEQNARMLRKRGLPVTPGTIYLAHFAGGAGAVAILSAREDADAASVMAGADATGHTQREKIIRANPFLERFTVADLRSWADRKMR